MVPQRPAQLFHPAQSQKSHKGGWEHISGMKHWPNTLKNLGSHQKKMISTGHFGKKTKLSMYIALLDKITKDHHQTNQTKIINQSPVGLWARQA